MDDFAKLLSQLILTPSRNKKIAYLVNYFQTTSDPDRGYALAAITRDLSFKQVKSSFVKKAVLERVDPVLFQLSYDYVGDLGETVALIWPDEKKGEIPSVSQFFNFLEETPTKELPNLFADLMDMADATQRWAMIKMITGGLRVGVSARLAKTALAQYGNVDLRDIEEIWHGLEIPYTKLFRWLDGKTDKPVIHHTETFHPMMLSNPIDEERDFERLDPHNFAAEWKWDGIRVQLVFNENKQRIFSRTGDDISHTFPDLGDSLKGSAVLDGELLVGHDFEPLDFNALQQRLNRKTVVKKHLEDYPAFVRVYDILFDGEEDMRSKTWTERRHALENWLKVNKNERLSLSQLIEFKDWKELGGIRTEGAETHGHEGIMLKDKTSPYLPGRPKGPWFKWKRDAKLADAVLMYAQRGHGKRSSFYSDYTFGVWKGNEIVPIGKAYFGFTDAELKEIDKWVRANTVARYGPVREVKKELVFEVAFDSAHESPRHKSGIALRFPRIHRIRWDKPAQEADTLEGIQKLVG